MSFVGKKMMMAAAGAGASGYWIALLGGSGSDEAYGVAIDSADNIIVAGETTSDGAGGTDILIAKYDLSGTLQWDRTLGNFAENGASGVAIDSSNNIIVGGDMQRSGYDVLIAKYNSSGTLQWDRTLGGTGNDGAKGVAIDSSNNIIVCGNTRPVNGDPDILIAKYNSSGTLQWDRILGGSNNDGANGVAIDSSNNIIVCGFTRSFGTSGSDDFVIAKYNSSGTLQWAKLLGGSGSDEAYGVAIDSADNIIVAGETRSDGAGGADILIAKYNSSGTLQWDKTLGGSGNDTAYGVAIDSADNIIVCGRTASDGAGGFDLLVAKLPPDGTGDGTYGNLIYQDAVLTSKTSTLIDSAVTLSDNNVTLTDAAAVLTDADAVLTEEFFEITP